MKEVCNCWESNSGQLVMTTSALPLSYNCHSNAPFTWPLLYILTKSKASFTIHILVCDNTISTKTSNTHVCMNMCMNIYYCDMYVRSVYMYVRTYVNGLHYPFIFSWEMPSIIQILFLKEIILEKVHL